MIKIEKSFPIPKEDGATRGRKYPFSGMEIGDSFFVSLDGREPSSVQNRLLTCGTQALGKKTVTTKRVCEDGIEGVRVWRKA